MKQKPPALNMLTEGVSIAHTDADLQVSKRAISDLKQAATWIPDNTMPTRKAGTGTFRLLRGGSKLVRMLPGSSNYDSKSTVIR